jgi:formylglycine-generating enzyme required for sulfatase activity
LTLIGSFPEGESFYGAEDMAGNVLEWTSSRFVDYPYDASDGREDLMAEDDVRRVVRGGSWFSDANSSRAAVRSRLIPASRGFDLGFRVVVLSAPPSLA